MRKIIAILIVLLAGAQLSLATTKQQEKINRQIFDRVYTAVKDKADLPTGELALLIGKQFLGTEYVGFTLEVVPEDLQILLDKTDCILFVEMISSFALTVKGLRIEQAGDSEHYCIRESPSVSKAEPSYELLCDNIRNMRYRLGRIDGYGSRIHYTSEWILQAQTNGLLEELSKNLGEPMNQSFFYMTTHKNQYKQLLGDDEQTAVVRAAEDRLNRQVPYYYISQDLLRKPEIISRIKDGDIVTFVDKLPGLDLAHVAMACTGEDGQMHFIHASLAKKKVVLESKTLADYATRGIRVCRLR